MESLGVIVAVDGDIATVGMYNMSNDSTFLWDGNLLNGPKIGAFLTIEQNDIRIISTVISEKVQDQQNTVNSEQFDNRYRKNSINRILMLKTQGVIEKDKFQLTSQYVPMVGNKVVITTKEDVAAIYAVDDIDSTISIGKSIREGQKINLPINEFFASHIGIFGNTGSGKSNTLHKLYLELFKSKYRESIFKKSRFVVIDFNGEYTQEKQFGIENEQKGIFRISTRGKTDKIPITKEYFLDPEFLSLLFSARRATQVPFLKNAIRKYKEIKNEHDFGKLEIGLLESILKSLSKVGLPILEEWISIAQEMGIESEFLDQLQKVSNLNKTGELVKILNENGYMQDIVSQGVITKYGRSKLPGLEQKLQKVYEEKSQLGKLLYFLEFQKIYVTAWAATNAEHINPLFSRIEETLNSLEPLIELVDEKTKVEKEFKCLNIISLVNTNQEIKRLIPMMLSKMLYDIQKKRISEKTSKGEAIDCTCHLIIDEAHNILNAEHIKNGDNWQDYRLSIFEEIIKEGRKFGFYLTLASQRPADISPTIMSQIHNFFIHRLVNDNDLDMLSRTVPSLDKNSYKMLPTLGKGEALVTGSTMKIPMLLKVDKEESIRPKSDDIKLTTLWES
ncbi:ATP-binding protein [Lactobacillus apis]|uniref:ATP-binding protein n=1 Tax=Lactobacillus apis TaxID=303541 RepID=UPI0024320B4D|nr:ATP-binding protein [Lactobacillus apis]